MVEDTLVNVLGSCGREHSPELVPLPPVFEDRSAADHSSTLDNFLGLMDPPRPYPGAVGKIKFPRDRPNAIGKLFRFAKRVVGANSLPALERCEIGLRYVEDESEFGNVTLHTLNGRRGYICTLDPAERSLVRSGAMEVATHLRVQEDRRRSIRGADRLAQLYDHKLCLNEKGDLVLYMLMERIKGLNLQEVLNLHRDYSPQEKWRASSRSLQDLGLITQYLNSRHIDDRDLKPANLIVTPDARIVTVDKGLALGQDLVRYVPGYFGIDPSTIRRTNTRSDLLSGTPRYMSFEQAAGHSTPLSNIYSIILIEAEWVMGKHPFDTTGMNAVNVLHTYQGNPHISYHVLQKVQQSLAYQVLPKDLQQEQDRIILQGLHSDPEQRREVPVLIYELGVGIENHFGSQEPYPHILLENQK